MEVFAKKFDAKSETILTQTFFILTRIFSGGDDEDKKADDGEGEGEDE